VGEQYVAVGGELVSARPRELSLIELQARMNEIDATFARLQQKLDHLSETIKNQNATNESKKMVGESQNVKND
jgi:site-specific recombinase